MKWGRKFSHEEFQQATSNLPQGWDRFHESPPIILRAQLKATVSQFPFLRRKDFLKSACSQRTDVLFGLKLTSEIRKETCFYEIGKGTSII